MAKGRKSFAEKVALNASAEGSSGVNDKEFKFMTGKQLEEVFEKCIRRSTHYRFKYTLLDKAEATLAAIAKHPYVTFELCKHIMKSGYREAQENLAENLESGGLALQLMGDGATVAFEAAMDTSDYLKFIVRYCVDNENNKVITAFIKQYTLTNAGHWPFLLSYREKPLTEGAEETLIYLIKEASKPRTEEEWEAIYQAHHDKSFSDMHTIEDLCMHNLADSVYYNRKEGCKSSIIFLTEFLSGCKQGLKKYPKLRSAAYELLKEYVNKFDEVI